MNNQRFQKLTRWLLTSGLLLATILALAGPAAPAAAASSITVDSVEDTFVPGDGHCTLKEAVTNANNDSDLTGGDCAAGSGVDNIQFNLSGTITLSSTLTVNDPDGLTIDGMGQNVTISGNNTVQVIYLDSAALTLKNLVIADGFSEKRGGGVENYYGTLTVTNSTFSGNRAGVFGGGGIYSWGNMLAVNGSTFSDNSASSPGGGIYNTWSSTLAVTNSTFSGNSAQYGGGIYNDNNASLAVTGSTFSDNSARLSGGGIYHKVFLGKLLVTNSTFTNNSAGSNGGAIYDELNIYALGGSLTVTDSSFSGNSAWNGAGIYFVNNSSQSPYFQLTSSTLSGNSAGYGGGIYTGNNTGVPSYLYFANSTFASNSASYGGGIYNVDMDAIVINNTFSGNSASDEGGGIYFQRNQALMDLVNTMVVNSLSGGNCSGAGIVDHGGNLSYPDNTCPGINADPLLGTLADNGGQTLTIAIPANSPAIDSANPDCPATDQRGISRPQGAGCDIGAYENSAPAAEAGGPYLGAVSTAIQFDGGGSSDPDKDPLTYAWDFGDGGTGEGQMPSHSYTSTGIYAVCLVVNDSLLSSDPSCTIAVVYDPEGGFVTGGGWIDSPEGAYTADPTLAGKARFGFVSKFTKGASTPSGNTEFQFQAAGFSFHSENYDWLLINQNGTNAQFKGSGRVNGALDPNGSAYKFMLSASDGSPDTFHIRIWWEDSAGEHAVYDNGTQAIGGGNIVVHSGN